MKTQALIEMLARGAGPAPRAVAAQRLLPAAGLGALAALWQHFQAAASASCNMTFADRVVSQWLGLDSLWPEVFAAYASCADAAVKLAGVSYEFYSLALYALLAFIAQADATAGAAR